MKRFALVLLCALLLLPSAHLAWKYRGMPHLGFFHDDAIYWICAKSLAEGKGYRVQSAPGEPYQTKYPPLYPLLLSVVWRLAPGFPGNLPWAVLLNWLTLPLYVAAAKSVFDQLRVPRSWIFVLCAFLVLNPNLAFFSVNIMPELLFSSLTMTCLVVAERPVRERVSFGLRGAGLGLLGAAAYLTKAAGLPLLFTVPAGLLLRKRRVEAAVFCALMGPAVLLWNWWAASHRAAGTDHISLYYHNYLGFYRLNVSWPDLPSLLLKNVASFFRAVGWMIALIPEGGDLLALPFGLLAAVAVFGAVRCAREIRLTQHHLFGALYLVQLLLWNYPPTERFLLPLLPLLLAGICFELRHMRRIVSASLSANDTLNRAWKAALTLTSVALIGGVFLVAVRGDTRLVPATLSRFGSDMKSDSDPYSWILRNLPQGAQIVAGRDPLVYLHTGRRGLRLVLLTRSRYAGDEYEILQPIREVADIAAGHRLQYLLYTPLDYHLDALEIDHRAVRGLLDRNQRLTPLYTSSSSRLYRIEDR